MDKKLVIVGASGHGKVVADIAKLNGYSEIIFLDDNPDTKSCAGYPVKGSFKSFSLYRDYDFFVGIGNSQVRELLITSLLKEGLSLATLIHPAATVAADAFVGAASAVMAGAVINSQAHIGTGCIVNTCASVDHDCVVEDFVHISVGAHLCGTVTVGANTFLGAGCVVVNNLRIADHTVVGAGAVVVGDIDESGTYVGVPAKRIK